MDDLIVGIDLGTTYSCVAYIDEFGQPTVVKNVDNESTTPSVVAFVPGEQEVLVGQIAKDQKEIIDKHNVVDFIKREMGNPNWKTEINGMIYNPQAISALILHKLVEDASASLGKEIKRVVVTHPAYYDIPQKSAVIEAGQIANLSGYFSFSGDTGEDANDNSHIPINLIPEPTAAAYYYGVKHSDKEETVLVFDLGGGTFDVTLLRVSQTGIEALCIGGDHYLGGKNWDDEIVKYFLASNGISEDEIEADPCALGALQLRVEKAKKSLSAREKTPIHFTFKGNQYNLELSREEFNQMTSHLLEQTVNLCEETLKKAASKGYEDFDRVLLVGGSTRMLQVQERLAALFPNKEIKFHEPDEAVAKGAAVYANLLMIDEAIRRVFLEKTGREYDNTSKQDVDELSTNPDIIPTLIAETGKSSEELIMATKTRITNITSKSFGIKCLNNGELKLKLMISSQTRLPATYSEVFGTEEDNQPTAEIVVMETDMMTQIIDLENCTAVANDNLKLPGGLPRNTAIRVSFTINEQGQLSYQAMHEASHSVVEGIISVVGSMTQEEIEEAKNRQAGLIFS